MVSGVIAIKFGAVGRVEARRSADPDLEVDALFPCLLKMRSEEPRMEEVVEILNVWCESPPVPTISHFNLLVNALICGRNPYKAAFIFPSGLSSSLHYFL
jgi:hypothetical protein